MTPGTKLGPYEILAPIGKGGMGEVWKARDTRLGRDVAIKISSEQFSERFEREARAVAALNHPNICTLHDVGPNYLVMEYIEGATLAERIKEGPIPLDEALSVARHVADALDAAHEKNIIHRDLKPGNIKIKPDGTVKVLDFGLAKMGGTPTAGKTEDSPTLTMAATQAGMILGTAAYMSPEQARGKEVDKRADIWAFGVVLYEMVTGKPLFQMDDVTDTLAAVLRHEPDWEQVPNQLQRLLRKCLEKDPKKRLRDIGDAWELLEEASQVHAASALVERSRHGWAWLMLAALGIVCAGVLGFVHFREMPPVAPGLNLSVPLPEDSQPGFVALSPDGKRLALGLVINGKAGMAIRALDSPELSLMAGTESARSPFWSPDSKSVGFFSDGKLKIIPATGGPAQVLCDGAGTGGGQGTWNRNGVILFSTSSGNRGPIRRTNAAGGSCVPVTQTEGNIRHLAPEFLPDGKHFVFVILGGDEAKRGIYIASLDDPTPKRLLADQSGVIYARSATRMKYGYLLFLRGSELMAQPFDSRTLQFAGDVFPLGVKASFNMNAPALGASVSDRGILALENIPRQSQLVWLDRTGKELAKVGTLQEQHHVGLSPDETRVATNRLYKGLLVYDLQRGSETLFASDTSGNAAVWSPDGKLLAFSSAKSLIVKDTTGAAKEDKLFEAVSPRPSDWSRDGRYVIYSDIDPKGNAGIWYLERPLNPSSDHKPVQLERAETRESEGQLSPDGHWLAFVAGRSDTTFDVYVRPFPSGSQRWKVSIAGGFNWEPRWRRDGKELFFLESSIPNNRLMAVAVESDRSGDFKTGTPQKLFEFRAVGVVPDANSFLYSPSGDGKRFLVNIQPNTSTVSVITNWEKAALGAK